MYRTIRRRLLGVAAAATAAVAITTPAYAAAPQIVVLLPDATVAAGASTTIMPLLFAVDEVTFTNAKATFQLGDGLAGVSLRPAAGVDGCTAVSPTTVTCEVANSHDAVDPFETTLQFAAEISATAAALGETGKVTYTLSGDGIQTVTKTVDVTVAEGVDLAAGPDKTISVKPGAGFDAGLQVHNNSDSVVHGAAVVFLTDYPFASTQQFSNCFYGDGQVTACTFDQDLQPGASYQLAMPYQLRKDTAAPSATGAVFEWLPGGDWDDLIKFLDDNGIDGVGTPGKGGAIALQPTPTSQSLKQTDPNYDNNFQALDVNVTGKQGVDLAAVGATATGAAGTTVTVPVGVKNNGPATLNRTESGFGIAALITIPAGASVASFPEDECFLNTQDTIIHGDPKAVQYACFTDDVLPAGDSVTWKFGLKINKATPGATGSVALYPTCECEWPADSNKANDTAKIVLNPAGAGQPGGGSGGGLPITGPQTALIGAAGVALLAGGAAFFALSRRRRTRFEA
ncbi:hypothetical protein ODJ79_09940 [Actinoplanes sp. KI2]|uniref:hypothetical protein n=1 Tax=Actinoplanes sp. KI2 TaxID=2983315 RepID=UPI0021D5CF5B|nr:hypothetical protein [Actinoplanes sp. KI2]MCU7724035.1 hypothetical protein [Actinoplanes sp. KI2]